MESILKGIPGYQESILKGIPGVVVYIDDVLVTGKMEEENLAALEETLSRLVRAGLRLQKKKINVPSWPHP